MIRSHGRYKSEQTASDIDPWAFVFSMNVARRDLTGHERGRVIWAIAERRGVRLGTRGAQKARTDTVSVLAGDLGISARQLRRDVRAADDVGTGSVRHRCAEEATDYPADARSWSVAT